MKTIQLNDGNTIPALGFGTYSLNGSNGVNAITGALNTGYRLIDSAVNYENEGAVGEAIRRSGLKRSEIFVTSKLPGRHHHYEEAINQIQESLYRTGLDYFDLYLIHWPNPKRQLFTQAWQALVDAKKFGLVRSIGVSNFEPEHIEKIVDATGVWPAVNQVELHPYFSNARVRAFDDEHQVVTQAWSPLGRGGEIFKEPLLQQLAEKYHKSAAQVILRWELQLGVGAIPKANSYAHQIGNLDIFDFELTNDEVASLTALDRPRNERFNPLTHEEF